jgi:hypothetical protein
VDVLPQAIPEAVVSRLDTWTQLLEVGYARRCCAVAFDDHNIKMAPIIKMIFTTEGAPTE